MCIWKYILYTSFCKRTDDGIRSAQRVCRVIARYIFVWNHHHHPVMRCIATYALCLFSASLMCESACEYNVPQRMYGAVHSL